MSNTFTKDSLSIDKPISGAISPTFKLGMAQVLAHGASKYGRDNWSKCKQNQMHLYWDALHRHLDTYQSGEMVDDETELNHLLHAACNIMFLYELTKKKD